LQEFPRPTHRDELVESFFAQLAAWASTPRWSGGGFTRVVVELADQRGHPAHAIAGKHKAAAEEWLADALCVARVASPRERACELMLLMEGAMALMLIHGDRRDAAAAADAARRLVGRRVRSK
jgi:hypothetical protein